MALGMMTPGQVVLLLVVNDSKELNWFLMS